MKSTVLGIGIYTPPQSYNQKEALEILGYEGNKMANVIVKQAAINTRNFYKTARDFGEDVSSSELTNYHREYAPLLAAEALKAASGEHFDLTKLDAIVTTTSTGFMSPGIAEVLFEAYHIGRANSSRYNLVGTGCVGTIPSMQLAQSLIGSGQAQYVGVVCAEAVAALFNPHTTNRMTMMQNLIFGEGSAALIVGNGSSQEKPVFRLIDSYQELTPHSLDAIAIRQNNFWENITDKSIPSLINKLVPSVVHHLLDTHKLTKDDIGYWAFHTGGRRILEECQTCLELRDDQMAPSYDILHHYGNMLSASVLFSLQRVLQTHNPQSGEYGMLIALGPGMTGGAFLIQWE